MIDSYDDEEEGGNDKCHTKSFPSSSSSSSSSEIGNSYHCPICKTNILLTTNTGNIICTGLSSNNCNLRLELNKNNDTTTIKNLSENCKRIEEYHSSSHCSGELLFLMDGCLPLCDEIDNDDMGDAIGSGGEGKFLFCKCEVCGIAEIVV